MGRLEPAGGGQGRRDGDRRLRVRRPEPPGEAARRQPGAGQSRRRRHVRPLLLQPAWQVLETRDTTTESDQPENLQPDYQYVWSPRYIDAPVLRDENTDADGLCDDERLYYLGDANFNVTTLVDTGGDAVERYLYEPYGKATIYDGSWSRHAEQLRATGTWCVTPAGSTIRRRDCTTTGIGTTTRTGEVS